MLRSVLLVLLLLPLCTGCVAVAAAGIVGVGLVQFQRNEVARDFSVDLECAWQATLEGLRKLAIVPERTVLTGTEGEVEREDLRVFVERHPRGFTRVRIRVGAFRSADNRRRAEVLLQEIATVISERDELRAWVEDVHSRRKTKP
jgi:hypothetical protein